MNHVGERSGATPWARARTRLDSVGPSIERTPSGRGRLARDDAWGLALFTACWLNFAGRLLFMTGHLFSVDHFSNDAPARMYAAHCLRQGQWPTWNPLLLCGFPFLSESQVGIFYPPFYLYVLWPSIKANDLYACLHYYWAGLGVIVYLRHRGFSPLAAALTAITLMTGQSSQMAQGLSGGLAVASFLPWAVYLLDKVIEGNRRAGWMLALVNAVIVLPGVPNITVLVYASELCYLVVVGGLARWAQWPRDLSLMYLFPAALAAVQVAPLIEFFLSSNRAKGTNWDLVATRVAPRDYLFWANFVHPSTTLGDLWRRAIYCLIAGLAVSGIARRGALSWRVQWVLLMTLSYGAATGMEMFQWIWRLPILSIFQYPVVYLMPAVVSFHMLVGNGIDGLLRAVRRRWPESAGRWAWGVGITLGALLSTDHLGHLCSHEDLVKSAWGPVQKALSDRQGARLWPYDSLYVASDEGKNLEATILDGLRFAAANSNQFWRIPVIDQFDMTHTVSPGPIVELFAGVPEDSAWTRKLMRMGGVTHLSGDRPPPFADLEILHGEPPRLYRLPDALGPGWMVFATKIENDSGRRLSFLRSNEFDPASQVVLEKDLGDSLETVSEPPPRALTLGGERVQERTPKTAADWKVIARRESPTRVVLDVETASAGVLVIPESYSPSTVARMDGAPAKVFRANHAFRAVFMPSGKHRVEMVEENKTLLFGALISLAAITVWVESMIGWGTRLTASSERS